MVDFNPEVQPVGIPDETGATRPIQQPEADKSKGMLFAGIGKSLSDAGDLYKESIKVQDYTNKEATKATEMTGLNALREDRIKEEENRNVGFEAAAKGLMSYEGNTGGDSKIDPETLPPELRNAPSKAQQLASYKADASQLDIYYKARVDMFLKGMRQQYPQYSDWIDNVAEKNGFGNSANAYLQSLISSNLKIQTELADRSGMKELIPQIRQGAEKGWYSMEDGAAAMQGNPEALKKVMSIYTREAASEGQFKKDLERSEASERTTRVAAGDATRATTARLTSMVANDLKTGQEATVGGLGEALERAKVLDINSDPNTIQQVALNYQKSLATLKLRMNSVGDEKVNYRSIDPTTGEMKEYPTSVRQLMGDKAFNDATDQALKPYNDIHEAMGFGKFKLAMAASQEVQAKDDATTRAMYKDPQNSAFLSVSKQLKDLPEASKAFVNRFTPDDMQKLGKLNYGVYLNNGASIVNGSQGAAEALERTKPAGSPILNQKLIEVLGGATDPKFTPEMRKNIIEGFFGPKEQGDNSILRKITDPAKRTLLFERMTSPEMVAEAKKQGGETWKHYYDYTTNEFGEALFKKDLNDLGDLETRGIPGFKITFNGTSKQYDIDIGKDKNVLNRDDAQSLGLAPGQEAYVKRTIIPSLRRINRSIGGLKNVLQEDSPEKIDSTLSNLMQGMDKDVVRNPSMIRALQTSIQHSATSFVERYQKAGEEAAKQREEEKKARESRVQARTRKHKELSAPLEPEKAGSRYE